MVERVTLYRAPTTAADADAIADWLAARVDATVTVRGRLLGRLNESDDGLPAALAEARVVSPYDRETGNTMTGILRYEERALEAPERAGGVIYDGLAVQDALRRRLETPIAHLHLPLVDRVLGTWGSHDGRWHKRVAVLGQPAVVSVPGLYEAPAKPEAYYQAKQSHALLSGEPPPREVLEEDVEGTFLVADDPRTTDALKGYALVAYHYLETGEAFCDEAGCRLYDAHRQPALVEAQVESPAFCERHAERYGIGE